MGIPKFGQKLSQVQLDFLAAFSKSCRYSIIAMLKNSQSGHPGGSLSSLDYLVLIYSFIISQTGEDVVVSHGHISPAVYSVLAELKYIPKEDVIENFRKVGSIYEGHITRHVPGVCYGTGPLGVGGSVASAFALSCKSQKTYALMGDGEAQEGQVYEMMNFALKNKLNNLIFFVDANKVQLTDSLEEIIPVNIKGQFEAAGWKVLECDGHDYQDMWNVLAEAHKEIEKPVMIIGNTIMGKGAGFMEEDGLNNIPTWHGKAPSPEDCDKILAELELNEGEVDLIENYLPSITWKPKEVKFEKALSKVDIKTGDPIVYEANCITDCRTAYGKALLDLAKLNPEIIAMSADLRGSVMTKFVALELPEQHIECGIAEQHMISIAGGLSLRGRIPFSSTFGAFISSRAKDQARVNDINQCNVKMVATHCGLSVGEDGPTHQAIDDMGSFLGFYNTMVIEPADPKQTDGIIRYIASHYGNFCVRMGRHKFPVITKEDGTVFYDKNYEYKYGRTDILREGTDVTIAGSGAMIQEVLKARDNLLEKNIFAEVVAVSSIKKFDETILSSIRKTKKLITIEDHNILSGLGGQLARKLVQENIQVEEFEMIGVNEYQFSGKADDLYKKAGMKAKDIENIVVGF